MPQPAWVGGGAFLLYRRFVSEFARRDGQISTGSAKIRASVSLPDRVFVYFDAFVKAGGATRPPDFPCPPNLIWKVRSVILASPFLQHVEIFGKEVLCSTHRLRYRILREPKEGNLDQRKMIYPESPATYFPLSYGRKNLMSVDLATYSPTRRFPCDATD